MEREIKNIILLGENVNTELKEASKGLPKSIFETVCSFLNTTGGYIILGVNDNKEIVGIKEELIDKIKKDYTVQCNNPDILNPSILSELKEIKIDGKILLYTHIEESNEIHKNKGKVYIRNYEGDFDISNNIPLIAKRHLWMDLTDKDLLTSAGLYKTDKINGKEGVTLAGVMIFGKDNVIRDVNPYCRTDSLYRVDDLDRYDDRDFVETNLIEMYDRLIDFIAKYTMDRFALDENARRVSPRNVMAREIILNTLMHRDITDGHTSK